MKRVYQRVSPLQRQQLIDNVREGQSVKSAALHLGIHYSNAKTILQKLQRIPCSSEWKRKELKPKRIFCTEKVIRKQKDNSQKGGSLKLQSKQESKLIVSIRLERTALKFEVSKPKEMRIVLNNDINACSDRLEKISKLLGETFDPQTAGFRPTYLQNELPAHICLAGSSNADLSIARTFQLPEPLKTDNSASLATEPNQPKLTDQHACSNPFKFALLAHMPPAHSPTSSSPKHYF